MAVFPFENANMSWGFNRYRLGANMNQDSTGSAGKPSFKEWELQVKSWAKEFDVYCFVPATNRTPSETKLLLETNSSLVWSDLMSENGSVQRPGKAQVSTTEGQVIGWYIAKKSWTNSNWELSSEISVACPRCNTSASATSGDGCRYCNFDRFVWSGLEQVLPDLDLAPDSAQLPSGEQGSQPVPKYCHKCGSENTNLGRFCSDCGASLVSQEIGPSTTIEDRFKTPFSHRVLNRLNGKYVAAAIGLSLFVLLVFIKPQMDLQTNKDVCQDFNTAYARYLYDKQFGYGLTKTLANISFSSEADRLYSRATDWGIKVALEKDSDTIGNLRKGRLMLTPSACKKFVN